ncbi:hypothetical protein B0H11DRAFT_1953564 [Mycena galericulata]|nr:hypothetical protein B0H11DRAFT_1953564 [Mycena galericulata]
MIAGGSVAGLLICAITILAVLRRRRSQCRATDIEPFSEAASTEGRNIFSALIPTPHGSRGSSKARSSRTDEMDQSPPPSSRMAVVSLPVVTELPPPYPPLGHYAQE